MRALILAAGRGTRISRYLSGKPKCTVDIGGITLIENTINKLKESGIKNIALIVGYNQNEIRKVLENYEVEFYYNPFYDVTNSAASAWFAKEFIKEDEDLIIMNGDVYVESLLLEEVVKEKMSPVLFADNTRKEEADYKFYYENNVLIKYGKELEGNDITGEYVGIAKINKDFIKLFKESLENMINNQKHGLWWENALYRLSDEKNIYVKDVDGKFWAEVDYIEDYERILAFRDYNLEFSINVCKQ
ncbi:phosphocholine cytidylyltransferase family protein [Clostridium perfringens]|uniref:phosphocholine cytidylyltransferase family protein n=1 Tax=Clostridium perfringens TaxID=1502 RepID=UPI001A22A6D0|nr:phosphocholine cytidylyltransferase family protein [Clostridium perfringens]EHR0217390.1 phosphocholine cytidylyltransferase family protein [Clostridium perfringens]EHR0219745.1 phosphocholine cytidylyltransferase family protein [Clostridium perfringens]ELC8465872.1 phosphocholine cytidylyltransferase family protein [Clostridium perfringens]ELC8467320.1 phosphocholine cytidylyltransferase family protein [Clostridium perfringens]MDN4557318.1 phosphocholine cytidylyltransferase family protein